MDLALLAHGSQARGLSPGKRGQMARRLFDNLLDSGLAGRREKKRAVSLPVSIGIHVAVLSAVVDPFSATDPGGHTLPMIGRVSRFRLRERSGLTRLQLSPRSSLRYTNWLAK